MSDRITDLDERIRVLHEAFFPQSEGWGRTVWFSKQLMERAALERTASCVGNWARNGVPDNVDLIVERVIGELAGIGIGKHMAIVDLLGRVT